MLPDINSAKAMTHDQFMKLRDGYASMLPNTSQKIMTHDEFVKIRDGFTNQVKHSENTPLAKNFMAVRKQSRTQGGNRPPPLGNVEV